MSTAFGNMNGATALALNGIFAGTTFGNYTFRVLTDANMNNSTDGIPRANMPDAMVQMLTSVQDLWNLDRSEAARRVYINAWITQSMAAARNGTCVITPEETIAATLGGPGALPGHGRIDYLICEMVAGPMLGAVVPEYAPSVIIEAKLDLSIAAFSGVGQLVAELETLRVKANYGTDPLRGVITDGRHWRFVELLPLHHDVSLTPLYDTGIPGAWNAANCRCVWGRMRQFLSKVRNTQVLMT